MSLKYSKIFQAFKITRDKGIGAEVSVRGSDQNRIEINGRGTSPSADSRGGISFADLPAALVRSLHVVKVPTADMVEGSLGGTIDVKTYRGLKLQKPLRVVRLTSEYAEMQMLGTRISLQLLEISLRRVMAILALS